MKHHQCICTKKKCPTISTVVATIFITSSWALLSQTCAFSNLHYAPQEKALLHRLMMSSIPSSPDIESNDQKSSAEKRWRSDIISSSTVNSRDEAYTTPTEKAPLDFFSAMFGNQPLSTSLPTNVLTAVDETKRQPEMWDYIQAALAPYYEAVYGLQESLKFKFSIASSQNQLPLHKRVLKAAYEESFPWLVSIIASSLASFSAHSLIPIEVGASAELLFFFYCAQKVIFRFNLPTAPQPMLGTRDWKKTQDRMWSSHRSIEKKRNFVMGYFYNVPFEKLRKEDALAFLAWVRFGTLYEFLHFDNRQQLYNDLGRLEEEVGMQLLQRDPYSESPLPIIRFNIEHFRFRHKPLPFYGFTHGTHKLLSWALPHFHGFSYHPPQGGEGKGLGYWYRPPRPKPPSHETMRVQAEPSTLPLVFVHGVGGMCFYYRLLEEISRETDGSIILLDLPFVSLRIADEIPSIFNQIQSIEAILDSKFGPGSKVSFAGHSFGSIVLSWMVQAKSERVANCIFIDPVCFQQHLSKSLFNFHLQRVDKEAQEGNPWSIPISIDALMNLAGTEMHTNNAMLRHFWWNTNALWPEDLEEKGIATCILLSEHDKIVPSSEVHHLICEFNKERGEKIFESFDEFLPNKNCYGKKFVRSFEVPGANHGELLFSAEQRKKVLETIKSMLTLTEGTDRSE